MVKNQDLSKIKLHIVLADSAWRSCTKNKQRIQIFKETGDSWYIYQNELDKGYFQNDMAHRGFKELTRKPILIIYCMIKHLILLELRNMMDINLDSLLQWFIHFLIKKCSGVKIRIFQTKN